MQQFLAYNSHTDKLDYKLGKRWFSLVMYGFCSKNNLCSVSLPFICMFYHVTYTFQSECIFYSGLNVKKLHARKRRDIWSLSDCSGTQTYSHEVWVNGWVFSKHEEITFPHQLIFVFISYFIGVMLSKKCQKCGVWEKDKKGVGQIEEVVYRKG